MENLPKVQHLGIPISVFSLLIAPFSPQLTMKLADIGYFMFKHTPLLLLAFSVNQRSHSSKLCCITIAKENSRNYHRLVAAIHLSLRQKVMVFISFFLSLKRLYVWTFESY
jgi:hypothetical protein